MRTMYWLLFPAFIVGLTGCGSADSDPTGTSADKLTFTTPEFSVPAGDSFTCFYTNTFTDKELSVVNASGQQGLGGHHILVYYTDVQREVQFHKCIDSEMVNWHQVSGSAGQDDNGKNGILGLPEGFAIKVPAGKQLVLQAHYINTTGMPMTVKDTVTLNLTDPAKVENYVNYFVTDDEGFSAPPLAPYEHTSICTVDRDLKMILSLGHMHEYGNHFRLDVIDGQGNTTQTIRDDTWAPEYTSHPPITYYSKDVPLVLTKGMRLKQTCSWNNTTVDPLLFPREMCVAFMYHFPGNNEDLVCDMVGQ